MNGSVVICLFNSAIVTNLKNNNKNYKPKRKIKRTFNNKQKKNNINNAKIQNNFHFKAKLHKTKRIFKIFF